MKHKHDWQVTNNTYAIRSDRIVNSGYGLEPEQIGVKRKFICECGVFKIVKEEKLNDIKM